MAVLLVKCTHCRRDHTLHSVHFTIGTLSLMVRPQTQCTLSVDDEQTEAAKEEMSVVETVEVEETVMVAGTAVGRELVGGGRAGCRGVSVATHTRLWMWRKVDDTDAGVKETAGRARSKRTAISCAHIIKFTRCGSVLVIALAGISFRKCSNNC